MNLKKIAKYLSAPVPDKVKRSLILGEIAKDKDAIPHILEILKVEREEANDMLKDANVLIGKADIAFNDTGMMKRLKKDNFYTNEVEKFYQDNNILSHPFKTS